MVKRPNVVFILLDDFGETMNLAGSRPEITLKLHKRLKQWRAEIEAAEPTPNPEWPW